MRTSLYLIIFILLCSAPKENAAQSPIQVNQQEQASEFRYALPSNSFISNIPLNEVNAKAFRHFEKNYRNASHEKWIKTPGGFVVLFQDHSVNYKIYYSQKGGFMYSYKYYESNWPRNLLKKILAMYPAYQIKNVVEVYDGNRVVCGINIMNGIYTITLELRNEELKVLDEYENQDYSK
jgi:hypothetical protein